jgi:uncharacterized protein (TIGR00369 family)
MFYIILASIGIDKPDDVVIIELRSFDVIPRSISENGDAGLARNRLFALHYEAIRFPASGNDGFLRDNQNTSMTQLRDNQYCYVCGKKNPIGLSVDFEINKGARTVRAKFIPSANHQGYEGIVHGGILSSVLDEAMAKLAYSLGIPAVTAEITIKFTSPAAPGDELLVSGRLTDEGKRLILAEAAISRGPVVIAEAKGKLLRTS